MKISLPENNREVDANQYFTKKLISVTPKQLVKEHYVSQEPT
jgi:hypothetical protein